MYIKVLQCSKDTYWYKDLIGTVFEVKFRDDGTESYVVDNIDGLGTLGSIYDGDYEEVEEVGEETLFLAPQPEPDEKDIEIQKLKTEIEVTQSALNDLLMNIGGIE